MSTSVYPPLPSNELKAKEDELLAKELDWLLDSLQSSLAELKNGLEECMVLLAPEEPGSTLVLSSLRSESIKGWITRVGSRIVKGDIHLQLHSLPPPRGQPSYHLKLSSQPSAPDLVLTQLISVRNLINQSLDVVDVSTWTGDYRDANFIAGQLKILHDNLSEAKQALRGGDESQGYWWSTSADEKTFDPPLPPHLSFHLSIYEAALELHLRTVCPADSSATSGDPFAGFSIRDRLSAALGGPRKADHDEVGEIFTFRGHEVKVKEKVKVDSQDPSLLAVMAKLNVLEHNVATSRKSLDIVMGRDE
ncbi:MAG: hypothetical protein M1834_003386 [Cirrosporium novae-zelandiae]|nr:MAG: hypothetical protein M1834_003386 [Cirrosporium novae-zelandiae]